MAEKTEQPTPRRLRKARSEGDSPVSSALTQGVAFAVAVLVAPAAVAAAAHRSSELLLRALREEPQPFSPTDLAVDVVTLTLPLVAAAAFGAVCVGLIQSGGVFAFKKVAPDLNRANPFTGLANLVTWQRIASLLRALVAGTVVATVVVYLVLDRGPDLGAAVGQSHAAGAIASVLTIDLARYAAFVGLVLAAVDLLLTHRAWLKRLRMTKDEVRREHKEAEGDPEVKAARRRAHEEALQGATLTAVRDATVVVVNPTHLATALRYDEEREEAPRVIAHGRGELARRIIDAAHAYGVPVVRDVPVARALSELEVGDEIPEALFETVAEILREIWEREDSPESAPR